MARLMYRKHGAGLSAPQVGVMERIIIMDDQSGEDAPLNPMAFINPVITKRFGGQFTRTEGCLSLPGDYGPVKRAKKIVLHAFTMTGEEVNHTFTGMQACIVQHECDHLDGILFIDRSPKLKEEICSSYNRELS